jgi:hypothetical protein
MYEVAWFKQDNRVFFSSSGNKINQIKQLRNWANTKIKKPAKYMISRFQYYCGE